jgi:hypothetical protein
LAEGHFKRFWILEKFRFRLVRYFPSEAIWMPYKDVRDFIYRKKNEASEDDD